MARATRTLHVLMERATVCYIKFRALCTIWAIEKIFEHITKFIIHLYPIHTSQPTQYSGSWTLGSIRCCPQVRQLLKTCIDYSPFLNLIKKINKYKIENSFACILIICNTYNNEYKAWKIHIKFNCKIISKQNTTKCTCIWHCCQHSIFIIS